MRWLLDGLRLTAAIDYKSDELDQRLREHCPDGVVNIDELPYEVCVYPDSNKVLVRGVKLRGQLQAMEYFDQEPQPPKIFDLAKAASK